MAPIEYDPKALEWILANDITAKRYTKNRSAVATTEDGTVIKDGTVIEAHEAAKAHLKDHPDDIVLLKEDRENFL